MYNNTNKKQEELFLLFSGILLIIFLQVNAFSIKAQSVSFNKIYSSSKSLLLADFIELDNGNYILGEGIKLNSNPIEAGTRFQLIDSLGNEIKDTVLRFNGTYNYPVKLFQTQSGIISLSLKKNLTNLETDSLVFASITGNLDVINTNTILFSDTLIIFDINSYMDSERNIIITGSAYHNMNYHNYNYAIKVDTNFNLVNSFYISSGGFFYHSIEKDSSYYVFCEGIPNTMNLFQILVFNSNLDTIEMHGLSYYGLEGRPSPIFLNKDELLFTSSVSKSTSSHNKLALFTLDSNFNIIWNKLFGSKDTNYRQASFKSTSKKNQYVYIGGTLYDTLNPFDCLQTHLIVIKMDTNRNIIWKKTFPGKHNDQAVLTLATRDGGCLLGCWNTIVNSNIPMAVHLIKLDSNGQTTWIKNISFSKTKIRLYPNPASVMLNIELSASEEKISEIEIYNALGQNMLSINPQSAKAQIDIRRLPSGVYIMEGRTLKGQRFSGKFVKE